MNKVKDLRENILKDEKYALLPLLFFILNLFQKTNLHFLQYVKNTPDKNAVRWSCFFLQTSDKLLSHFNKINLVYEISKFLLG